MRAGPDMKYVWWTGITIILLVAFVLHHLIKMQIEVRTKYPVAGWLDMDDRVNVALGGGETLPELSIAIAPVISPQEQIQSYNLLADYLTKNLAIKCKIILGLSYAEVNEMIKHRKCDLALVCTFPFVQGEKEFGMEVLVAPRIDGEDRYQSYIIVPHESAAESIKDLKSKRFAAANFNSSSGWLFPALSINKLGEDPDHFFSTLNITKSHDLSIDAVLSGLADGAAVHGSIFKTIMQNKPDLRGRLKIIGRSNEWGMPPFVVHPSMDDHLKKKLANAFLDMPKNSEGLKTLAALNIDYFFVPDAHYYDSIRKDIADLEDLRK